MKKLERTFLAPALERRVQLARAHKMPPLFAWESREEMPFTMVSLTAGFCCAPHQDQGENGTLESILLAWPGDYALATATSFERKRPRCRRRDGTLRRQASFAASPHVAQAVSATRGNRRARRSFCPHPACIHYTDAARPRASIACTQDWAARPSASPRATRVVLMVGLGDRFSSQSSTYYR